MGLSIDSRYYHRKQEYILHWETGINEFGTYSSSFPITLQKSNYFKNSIIALKKGSFGFGVSLALGVDVKLWKQLGLSFTQEIEALTGRNKLSLKSGPIFLTASQFGINTKF